MANQRLGHATTFVGGNSGGQSPTYTAWRGTAYRGNKIGIDPRWLHFENFLADMGEKPPNARQLRRLDLTKGFSKDNCRWA